MIRPSLTDYCTALFQAGGAKRLKIAKLLKKKQKVDKRSGTQPPARGVGRNHPEKGLAKGALPVKMATQSRSTAPVGVQILVSALAGVILPSPLRHMGRVAVSALAGAISPPLLFIDALAL